MCDHYLGPLACDNSAPHSGDGRGCTHTATWAPDNHSEGPADD